MNSSYKHTLSKSDFKLGRTCPTKLYYREHRYPDNGADSPMLEMLAGSGYRVEALAKALHGAGIALPQSRDAGEDFALISEHLRANAVTLFEATILAGRRLARIDILEKAGNTVRLIEVKSTSFDSVQHARQLAEGTGGLFRSSRSPHAIRSDWLPYLEDITYQTMVCRSAFPALEVVPYLLLVDKAKRTGDGYVPLDIELDYEDRANGSRRLRGARFLGDPGTLAEADILVQVDVSSEVAELMASVASAADGLDHIVAECDVDGPRPITALGMKCRDCEFRVVGGAGKSGFAECWGAMAGIRPHLLELYQGGRLRGGDGKPLVDEMAANGEASLLAVPAELLPERTTPGSLDWRRSIQIEHARSGSTWVSPELKDILAEVTYPLHFIDFEASSPAIPYHPGMAAYERVAFQLSCHTLSGEAEHLVHSEWLNDALERPDAAFARALRSAIGDEGTVLIWSPYETTTMTMIARALEQGTSEEQDLASWLLRVAGSDRILDLNKVALRHFFHPDMGGRTSIKVVLDALWRSDEPMRRQLEAWTGRPMAQDLSPYATLPRLMVDDVDSVVQEGTGAILAYEDMLYGRGKDDPDVRENRRNLLLQYCKLDTFAMVLIWDYWRRAVGAST